MKVVEYSRPITEIFVMESLMGNMEGISQNEKNKPGGNNGGGSWDPGIPARRLYV